MKADRGFYTTLLKLSVPVALQGLLTLLVNTADGIMVSSLGEAALTGVNYAGQLTNFIMMLLMGMASGSTVLISQYWGKRDEASIQAVFSVVLQAVLLVAGVSVVLLAVAPSAMLSIVTNETETLAQGIPYLQTVSFSLLFFAISVALASMLRSVELVNVTLGATVVSLLVNVLFNYLLIFGHFGFPRMGVAGAALATVIARVVECGIMVIYTFFVQKRIGVRLRNLRTIHLPMWLDYLRFGAPVALGDAQWALVGIGKSMIIGRLGQTMMAADSVATTMMGLIMVFSNSLTNGACVMIGKSVGERDYVKTRAYSKTIQKLFACVGVVMCGLVLLLRGPFLELYGNLTQETRDLAMVLIAVGALTMLGTSYHAACFTGINRGAGDAKFVFIVDMICGWFIVLPLSILAAFVWKLPLPMIFLMIRIDQCFKWIIAFFRLRGDKWIRNVTRNEPLEG